MPGTKTDALPEILRRRVRILSRPVLSKKSSIFGQLYLTKSYLTKFKIRQLKCLRFLDLPVFLFKFSMLHLNVKTEFSFEEQEDLVHWQVRQENLYSGLETENFCKRKTCCWSTMRRQTAAKAQPSLERRLLPPFLNGGRSRLPSPNIPFSFQRPSVILLPV